MWRRLLSYEYLLEPIPGQPAQFRFVYLLLAIGTGCSLLLATRAQLKRHDQHLRRALAAETILAAVALLLIGCAFAGVPCLSMRILVFGVNLAAVVYPIVVWVRQREPLNLWQRHRRALSGQMDVVQPSLPWGSLLLLLGVHLVSLTMLTQHYGWLLLSPLLLLAGLLIPQWLFSLSVRRWRVHLEALAPLFLLYSVLATRLMVLISAKVLLAYPGFSLPARWDALLNVDVALFVALSWSLLSQVYAILRYQRRERLLLPGIAAGWLVLSFAWASYTYVHHHTHGVTGSDPYCYAQMAVDLAEHHVPVHHFPLVARMEQLGVFPEAGIHLGYHLPFDASGRAATVWPVGQSLLLAVGYGVAGEKGLYLTTPVLGLLSLAALAALSWELWSGRSAGEKLLLSAVAVFLLATSYAQIERLVVPMADAAAQLFTVLTVLLWLQAMRSPAVSQAGQAMRSPAICAVPPSFRRGQAGRAVRRPQTLQPSSRRGYVWALLAGLSFGAAYLVRHTQLVLAASVLLLAWVGPRRRRQKAASLALFAGGALLFIVPDLLYHQWVMGHWLRPESLELRHFSLAFMGQTALRMARELFTTREFLYVSPFVLYGLLRQWREERASFGLLSSWAAAVLLIHLPYEALRLRDLLSLFPVLCLWAGCGVVALWRWIGTHWQRQDTTRYLAGVAYAWLLAGLLLLRTRSTLELPRAPDFDAFGHLNAFQRAGFVQIGRDTEEAALIGASLNSGAVELHSKRTTFRPAVWRADELYTFADDALSRGMPLYLLEDGLEMAAPIAAARQRYQLQLVGLYDIPFYHTGGGSTGARIPLYRLEQKTDQRRTP